MQCLRYNQAAIYQTIPVLWKNGVPSILSSDITDVNNTAISSSGSDVYVLISGISIPVTAGIYNIGIWKNG
jgi:hypothetical protein